MDEHRTSKAWMSPCCLFLLLAPRPGEAEVIIHPHTANALRYCVGDKIYSVHSTGAPSVIAASFAGDGKQVAFRTCQDGDGNSHYFIRKPRPNRNGVCRTFEDEVFPGTDNDKILVDVLYDGSAPNWYFSLKGWKAWPPDDWTLLHYTPRSSVLGLVSDEDCPTGEDARYLSLENVTDGMLKAFQSSWIEATRSSETLDKAFRNVPTVSGATVVIANPTHFAVALKYESGKNEAPICVAKGVDALALRIRAVAEENDVPVVENPPLARALHASVEVDEAIPPEHYKAVAQVIGYVMRLNGQLARR